MVVSVASDVKVNELSFSLSRGRPLEVGEVGIASEQLPAFEQGTVELPLWFDADRMNYPLELEIGSGKGTFLVQQAEQSPGINFVGIEYAKAFWRYAADRCRRHGLANVRLVRAEADFFVRNFVADAVFQQVHLYFPDPWPKKRHHKRRLVTKDFLGQVHRALVDEGLLRIATDHAAYFQWIEQRAVEVADLFERQPFVRPDSADEGELVGTNFERKYRQEGRSFYGMTLRKR